MVYVLVDRGDNIVDRKDLSDDIGVGGARNFFVGRKQIDEKKFDDLWKVMTYKKYKELEEMYTRKPSSEQSPSGYTGYIRWWEDEEEYLDLETTTRKRK